MFTSFLFSVGMISLSKSTPSSLLSTNTKLTSSSNSSFATFASTGQISKPSSADNEIVSSSYSPAETNAQESGQVGIAAGISIATIVLLLVIVIVLLAVFLQIKRKPNKKQEFGFSNPIYHNTRSINTSKYLDNQLYEGILLSIKTCSSFISYFTVQDVESDITCTNTLVSNSSGIYDEAVVTEEGITTEVFYSEVGMPLPIKVTNYDNIDLMMTHVW